MTRLQQEPTGKIHRVDPEAAARLKVLMAEKVKNQPQGQEPPRDDLLTSLLKNQHDHQEERNARMRKPEIPIAQIHHWHIILYQAGHSLESVAQQVGVSRNHLAQHFHKQSSGLELVLVDAGV